MRFEARRPRAPRQDLLHTVCSDIIYIKCEVGSEILQVKKMSLTIFTGPMGSGKTDECFRSLGIKSQYGKQKALFINSTLDTRGSWFSSRNPLMQGATKPLYFDNIQILNLSDADNHIDEFQVVAIDEGQFFKDLVYYVLKWVQEKHIHVIVCGLLEDSNQQIFGSIIYLLPHADSFKKLKGVCRECGAPSVFSKCLVEKTSQTLIGGDEKYIGVCRSCFA